MAKRGQTAIENTTQLVEPIVTPPKDGQAQIDKAIQVTELQQDLANLQRQSLAISGAIQYIQQKIKELNQKGEEDKSNDASKNNKSG